MLKHQELLLHSTQPVTGWDMRPVILIDDQTLFPTFTFYPGNILSILVLTVGAQRAREGKLALTF